MDISAEKTKLMTNNSNTISMDIRISGQRHETVSKFKYLGAIVAAKGLKPGILSRMEETTAIRTKLKTIMKDRNIALRSKIRLMHTLVISLFLYRYTSETWTHTTDLERKIKAIEMRCFRRLLSISCRDHIPTKRSEVESGKP
ncbi:endonuclease-reverse transcriptase [Plakobranchus ocellatus]|uniref:Endonuclease-reverse transcriptase n=1 Tax=Plakobranchus ocellatus TaxID=259542 RepID=A0AAV4CW35_9GAST|nr:endonuclease-reverse transcriptase [Plakobranchus ocellatus]